jgi:hypothetical protein
MATPPSERPHRTLAAPTPWHTGTGVAEERRETAHPGHCAVRETAVVDLP